MIVDAAISLDREMFSEAEAARLLRVPQSTLHYWLEGRTARGRTYKPVVRVDPKGGHPPVTWAEFVEAGLLREYRRTHQVPMPELRAFIDLLRARYRVPYPLAHHKPFIADRQLVVEAQDAAGLDADFCLVAAVRGQLILTAPSESFLRRVTWDGDVASGWRPSGADEASPVRMIPDFRFGRPAIKGVSTEVLWEQSEAGEEVDDIAETFHLSPGDVRWALAYEISTRAA